MAALRRSRRELPTLDRLLPSVTPLEVMKMTTKPRASDELMGELHLILANELLNRIKSGEASPAELNAAIKFLQNNKIQGEVDNPEDPTAELASRLPNFEDEYDG